MYPILGHTTESVSEEPISKAFGPPVDEEPEWCIPSLQGHHHDPLDDIQLSDDDSLAKMSKGGHPKTKQRQRKADPYPSQRKLMFYLRAPVLKEES